MTRQVAISLIGTLLVFGAPAFATHPCTSPLILDLNGDGVRIYGIADGVSFDINADGEMDDIAWTNPHSAEGFLWLDKNGNRVVDDGGELFGTATLLPNGKLASNGFEALASYDRPSQGGNGDGVISDADLIWNDLHIWVDRNQDGASQKSEIDGLKKWRIVTLSLDYVEMDQVDGTGTWHRFAGQFARQVRKLGIELLEIHILEDVFFASREESD